MTPLHDAGKKHGGKYVAYYRVSPNRQKSDREQKAQRQSVMDYLNDGNWTLCGEFVDVESGRRSKRPQLQEALDQCKKEKATLVIAKLYGLSRNTHVMTSLTDSGVEFVAIDNPHVNKLTIHALSVIAKQGHDHISETTTAALKAAKRRGVKLGNPNPDAAARLGRKVLVKQADDYAAKVMPIVCELIKQGCKTLRGIARGLSMRGIKTRRGSTTWHPSQVSNLLKRRT